MDAREDKETDQRQLMAYFSHSYRPEDNRVNLHFWDMFSRHNLCFAVDPPSTDRRPMDVMYLEWLMAQSACFISVIPRRAGSSPIPCSPYQIFEYRLAVRAGKPRLIFLQNDLEPTLLGIDPSEIITFRRRDLVAFRVEHERQASAFAGRVRQLADTNPQRAKPIGLVTQAGDPAYTDIAPRMRSAIQDALSRACSIIDPSQFDSDYRLLLALEDCEVLVSEVRPPHIPADLYGLIHGRALPTLRVARLAPGESPEDASAAMRLAAKAGDPKMPIPSASQGWPIVLSGYKIDPSMQPVLFWQSPEELIAQMSTSLSRINSERTVLDDPRKARDYFLRLGRLRGKVFISNSRTQNDLAALLISALRDGESIDVFHYTDDDRDASQPNWKDEIRREIERCTHFVALIDEGFIASQWCIWETEVAVELFRDGKLEMLTYKIDTERIPEALLGMSKHVQEIKRLSTEDKVQGVVNRVRGFFEQGHRIDLQDAERSLIGEILARQPELQTRAGLVAELQKSLPAAVSEPVVMKLALGSEAVTRPDLEMVIDALASHPTLIEARKTALGLFLLSATRRADPADRKAVWDLVRSRSLMPDIRLWIRRPTIRRELGLGVKYDGSSGTVGTFAKVHEGRLEGWQAAADRTGEPLLSGLSDLVSKQKDWQDWVAKIGKSSTSGSAFAPFQDKYRQATGPATEGEGLLSVCVASDVTGLRLPVDWATFDGLNVPLALKHPVRRYLLDTPTRRPTLRSMLTKGKPVPLRVLIVGAHWGDLSGVDGEVKELQAAFQLWFEKMGWPLSDIAVIEGREATNGKLGKLIQEGGYHVLHFAGHGWPGSDEPALAVVDSSMKDRAIALPASVLAEWVMQSDLRLVYLSSCRGAGDPWEDETSLRRFENLADAMVSAGVPEVVGFRWPIADRQSRTFAQRFYDSYLQEFDASLATFRARSSFRTEAQIWAAAVVIAQYDSP